MIREATQAMAAVEDRVGDFARSLAERVEGRDCLHLVADGWREWRCGVTGRTIAPDDCRHDVSGCLPWQALQVALGTVQPDSVGKDTREAVIRTSRSITPDRLDACRAREAMAMERTPETEVVAAVEAERKREAERSTSGTARSEAQKKRWARMTPEQQREAVARMRGVERPQETAPTPTPQAEVDLDALIGGLSGEQQDLLRRKLASAKSLDIHYAKRRSTWLLHARGVLEARQEDLAEIEREIGKLKGWIADLEAGRRLSRPVLTSIMTRTSAEMRRKQSEAQTKRRAEMKGRKSPDGGTQV